MRERGGLVLPDPKSPPPLCPNITTPTLLTSLSYHFTLPVVWNMAYHSHIHYSHPWPQPLLSRHTSRFPPPVHPSQTTMKISTKIYLHSGIQPPLLKYSYFTYCWKPAERGRRWGEIFEPNENLQIAAVCMCAQRGFTCSTSVAYTTHVRRCWTSSTSNACNICQTHY